jgi:hypothetical protein
MVLVVANNHEQVPAPRGSPRFNLGVASWTPMENMSYPEWVAVGRRIGSIGRASNWWVGDWLRYGTQRWGQKYTQAARMTGYDVHTLRNMAYVASRFGLSLRRDNLTWSHHALLAAMEPEVQCYWLDRATDERLSVADLRIELRSLRRGSHQSQDSLGGSATKSATPLGVVCPNCGYRAVVGDRLAADPGGTA